MAPADIGFLGIGGVDLLLLLFQFDFIEPGLQHLPGGGAVLVLRALALAGHDDAGRKMGDAHGGVGRVDMLAAGAGGAIGVDLAIAFIDLDIDLVVDDRIDPDRGK